MAGLAHRRDSRAVPCLGHGHPLWLDLRGPEQGNHGERLMGLGLSRADAAQGFGEDPDVGDSGHGLGLRWLWVDGGRKAPPLKGGGGDGKVPAKT